MIRRWIGVAATVAMVVGLAACQVEESEGDLGVANEGDLCKVEGTYACGNDFSAELICSEGEFVFSQDCPGGCSIIHPEDSDEPLLYCLDSEGNEK